MSGRPLPLVLCSADGRFSLGEEALAVLAGLSGPVGVVAVAGRARQGKSFVLNQLVAAAAGGGGLSGGRHAPPAAPGFVVASTHRPCTKGIWLWSEPVARTAADGSSYHLLLLDTEGIDAYDQTGQYSTQIFSLAVLLSSLFVYNHLGAIDEAALDKLALVAEVSSSLAAGGEGKQFTPAFLWLLRDFYLDLRAEDGRAMTPSEYLEVALKPVAGTGPAVATKNGIRTAISSLFPVRSAAALVRPVSDEKALQSLDSLPPSSLRPEFVAGVAALTAKVLGGCAPKTLCGDALTGSALAALASTYVAALNDGGVPHVASAWEGVAAGQCAQAERDAERCYDAASAAHAAAAAAPSWDVDAAAAAAAAGEAAGMVAFAKRAVGPAAMRAAAEARARAACAAKTAAAAAAATAAAAARVRDEADVEKAALVAAKHHTFAAAAAAIDAAATRLLALRGVSPSACASTVVAFLRSEALGGGGAAARAAAAEAAKAQRGSADARAEATSARREAQEAVARAVAAEARAGRAEADAAASRAASSAAAAASDAAAARGAAAIQAALAQARGVAAAAKAEKEAAIAAAAAATEHAAKRSRTAEDAIATTAAASRALEEAARVGEARAAAERASHAARVAQLMQQQQEQRAPPPPPPQLSRGLFSGAASGHVTLPTMPVFGASPADESGGSGAPAAPRRVPRVDDPSKLSVAAIRAALADNGCGAAVEEVERAPGAKKAAYVAAYERHMETEGAAGVAAPRRRG